MNTQQKVRKIRVLTNMDIFTFARNSRIDVVELDRLLTSGECSKRMEHDVNHFATKLGLCPECLERLIHQGGCISCLCGWSRC